MLVYSQNVCVLEEIWVPESISIDKFATRSRMNVLYWACKNIIVTKVAKNGVAFPKLPRLYMKTGALNSNVRSDFKPEVVIRLKLLMCGEKLQE